jgi:hypothetical protein
MPILEEDSREDTSSSMIGLQFQNEKEQKKSGRKMAASTKKQNPEN